MRSVKGHDAVPFRPANTDLSHRGKVVPFPTMPAKRKHRPASPLNKGGQRGVAARPSALLDTRIIYCGDWLDQLRKLTDACVDLIYIDPPFNSNRNYEVFWGESKENRLFEDRHASTDAYIEYMRPRYFSRTRRNGK